MRDQSKAIRTIEARMTDLGLGPTAFAKAVGISDNAFRDFMRGRSWPIARTLRRVEAGLEWPAGTIERLAEGEISAPNYPGVSVGYLDTPGPEIKKDADLLLSFPGGALDGLTEVEREVVLTKARLVVLEWLAEHKRGGDTGGNQ